MLSATGSTGRRNGIDASCRMSCASTRVHAFSSSDSWGLYAGPRSRRWDGSARLRCARGVLCGTAVRLATLGVRPPVDGSRLTALRGRTGVLVRPPRRALRGAARGLITYSLVTSTAPVAGSKVPFSENAPNLFLPLPVTVCTPPAPSAAGVKASCRPFSSTLFSVCVTGPPGVLAGNKPFNMK